MTSRRRPTAAGTRAPGAPRARPRSDSQSELQLNDEELRALADEGIDPDEVTRLSRGRADPEASEHDRGSARDDLEGLISDNEGDY